MNKAKATGVAADALTAVPAMATKWLKAQGLA